MNPSIRSMLKLLLAAATLFTAMGAPAQSVGSAVAPDAGVAKRQEALRMSPAAARPVRVAIGEAEAAEIDKVRRANALPGNKRLQIGITRDIPRLPESRADSLNWQPVAGGAAAHWQVSAAGARAMRLGFEAAQLPPGVEVRFAGDAGTGIVYGPYTGADMAGDGGPWWSPVLEGDGALVEVFAPGSVRPKLDLSLAQLSHLFASPADTNIDSLAKIGESESCEVDLICRSASDSNLASTGKAVARMTFSDSQGTYLCTGTLLNTTNQSFIPYFYSAAHCFSIQSTASTLTTHWFYDRTGCGTGGVSGSYVQVGGGATLLYANTSSDVLFLRLNQDPPSAAVFAGWDAGTLSGSPSLTAVHHPAGDVKKVSLGAFARFSGYNGASGSDHIDVVWNSTLTGVTEGGSSGSGIFSFSSSNGYQLRGGLHGGPSSCSASGSALRDYYSRFDQAYPSISQYLSPTATASNYTALWWNPNESGWGINFNHQGNIVFGTLFTYDSAGAPLWLVLPAGNLQSGSTYSGDLYRTTGPAFNAVPFTPITEANLTRVGSMTVTFSGDNAATLSYTVSGIAVTKSIQKQVFGSRAANCSTTTGSRASLTNYQDLWWNASESGWGVNVTHQDNTLFATLFTYDSSGRNLWLVMSSGTRQSDGSYLGTLFRTSGPPFNANPFTPINAGNLSVVGNMRFRFSDGNNGTLTYDYNGAPVSKSITRQVFASPVPACN